MYRLTLLLATLSSSMLLYVGASAQSGSIDPAFATGTGADDQVTAIVPLSSGKVLVAGYFTEFDGTPIGGIARLNSDGTLDNTFASGTGFDNAVNAMVVQPDGKIVVGGTFGSYNGSAKPGLVRLAANGAIDATFSTPGVQGGINTVALQSDGKILIGGTGVAIVGGFTSNLARLTSGGAIDASFDVDPGPNSIVLANKQQTDGKVMVGGHFTAYHGASAGFCNRVSSAGATDAAFQVGSGASSIVRSIVLQPDGKILLAGSFTMFNGTMSTRIVRLNTDGTVDTGFTTGSGANSIVHAMALQTDGKILIGGLFNLFNGTARNRMARLLANGALDLGFDIGAGANDVVRALATLPDGDVLVGGGFTQFDGATRGRLVRLNGGDGTVALSVKVLLEGPFNSVSGLMGDGLRSAGLVPLSEPYSALGYVHVGGGGEATSSAVLSSTGNDAVVDWVVVELRSMSNAQTVVATKSALVQRDGDVVGPDGTSPLQVTAPAGSYYVAVRHRNHLGVMTAGTITLGPTTTVVDLTVSGTATFGTNARKTVGTKQVLWAGDVTGNGIIAYTGAGNDRDPILVAVGGTVPTAVVNGQYSRSDVNMDGSIKYTGTSNDRDGILVNVGGTVPTAVRTAQLP
ncbi:MAG: delta-60 repeat domain-containing protein [Flavobacteriales bacterium]|nr:MAG: delta-60 repeat domain-containing protein [Flavobacteriales bacterium]